MFAPWKESYDSRLHCITKQRHHFANKSPDSQSYGFSSSHVWMWELDHKEGYVLKNWCFELQCWRRLLRVPWASRRSNQSILKEINPEYSLEGLMLKMKLQYFGHFMWRTDSLEKTLLLGKIEGRRRKGWQRLSRLNGITDLMDMSLSKLRWWTGKSSMLKSIGLQRVRHDWVNELNWILIINHKLLMKFLLNPVKKSSFNCKVVDILEMEKLRFREAK